MISSGSSCMKGGGLTAFDVFALFLSGSTNEMQHILIDVTSTVTSPVSGMSQNMRIFFQSCSTYLSHIVGNQLEPFDQRKVWHSVIGLQVVKGLSTAVRSSRRKASQKGDYTTVHADFALSAFLQTNLC